jgi:predicted HTH domain antitoxin
MKRKINIEYPESLANALNLRECEFKYEVKISSIVKLFELGKISSGIAAKVLGLSRIEFIELLAKYKVSIYGSYDIADLKEDIANV